MTAKEEQKTQSNPPAMDLPVPFLGSERKDKPQSPGPSLACSTPMSSAAPHLQESLLSAPFIPSLSVPMRSAVSCSLAGELCGFRCWRQTDVKDKVTKPSAIRAERGGHSLSSPTAPAARRGQEMSLRHRSVLGFMSYISTLLLQHHETHFFFFFLMTAGTSF